MIKKLLKNIAWLLWPTRKQLKERGLHCTMHEEPTIHEIGADGVQVPINKYIHVPKTNWIH